MLVAGRETLLSLLSHRSCIHFSVFYNMNSIRRYFCYSLPNFGQISVAQSVICTHALQPSGCRDPRLVLGTGAATRAMRGWGSGRDSPGPGCGEGWARACGWSWGSAALPRCAPASPPPVPLPLSGLFGSGKEPWPPPAGSTAASTGAQVPPARRWQSAGVEREEVLRMGLRAGTFPPRPACCPGGKAGSCECMRWTCGSSCRIRASAM